MDRDVAQTLAALERKLAELERELTHYSRGGADPGEAAALYSHALRGPADREGAMLVDEAVQRRYSMEAQETVFGEIPATKDERQSIELEELVRFKEKMQSTLQGLIDEYSRLLSIQPPPR